MLEEYIYKGTQRLRCGYTTGSCAAAAAKAAAEMLITREIIRSVSLVTPKGIEIQPDVLYPEIGTCTHSPKCSDCEANFSQNEEIFRSSTVCTSRKNDEVMRKICRKTGVERLCGQVLSSAYALCAIRKDGGDDPDATNGILIFAKVEKISSGIEITGGKGIGKVTKAGLDQPIGEYAINSVPRKMITSAVNDIAEKYCYHGGFKIEISAPEGEKTAAKTYNPRMGIKGGISIIGTSGIVEPMSNSALIETIRVEAKMRYAEGYKNLLLTLGNYSGNFIQNTMPFALEKSVKCSNFIGDAIDIAIETGFESVLIIGHIGKLVKLGAGIMNTHSAQADGRMDVLVTCGVLAGVDNEILARLPECATVDGAIDVLITSGKIDEIMRILSERADYYLNAKVKGAVKIGAVMFSDKHPIIIKTASADALIKMISEEYNG